MADINEFSVFSDKELDSIHRCLTKQSKAYTPIKKKTVGMPKKTATEMAIDEYYKDFDKLVKDIIKNA